VREDVIETMARAIAPGAWQIMDTYLANMKRIYAGKDGMYDPAIYKDHQSMRKAIDAIRALESAGYRIVGRDDMNDVVEAVFRTNSLSSVVDGEDFIQAAFDAAPLYGEQP